MGGGVLHLHIAASSIHTITAHCGTLEFAGIVRSLSHALVLSASRLHIAKCFAQREELNQSYTIRV